MFAFANSCIENKHKAQNNIRNIIIFQFLLCLLFLKFKIPKEQKNIDSKDLLYNNVYFRTTSAKFWRSKFHFIKLETIEHQK